MDSEGSFSQIGSVEEEKKEPAVGDYIHGNVAEPDPKGQTATDEGVIVGEGENKKEWKVVDPGRDRDYYGDPAAPDYSVRNVHKEGAEVVPVPWSKEKHVRELREQLGKNS
jgi:hypothetical protein